MLEAMEKGFDWLFACGQYENHVYSFNKFFEGSPFALGFLIAMLGGIIVISCNKKLRELFF
jgi:hypothetical protein